MYIFLTFWFAARVCCIQILTFEIIILTACMWMWGISGQGKWCLTYWKGKLNIKYTKFHFHFQIRKFCTLCSVPWTKDIEQNSNMIPWTIFVYFLQIIGNFFTLYGINLFVCVYIRSMIALWWLLTTYIIYKPLVHKPSDIISISLS